MLAQKLGLSSLKHSICFLLCMKTSTKDSNRTHNLGFNRLQRGWVKNG